MASAPEPLSAVAGKPIVVGFAEFKGATFERPIMNYMTLWQLKPVSKD